MKQFFLIPTLKEF